MLNQWKRWESDRLDNKELRNGVEATGTGPERPEQKRNKEKHKETQREHKGNGIGEGEQIPMQRMIRKHYQVIMKQSDDAIG
jgi:hypothetical protein